MEAAPTQVAMDRLLKGSNQQLQPTLKDIFPQVLVACLLHSVFMQAGINMAYSATTLPQMLSKDSSLVITDTQASWIASLVAIATLVGSLLCGPPMDTYGRKACAMVTCLPLIVGWNLMAFTPNLVWPIYVSRVLTGIGGGMTTVCLVYIGEICHHRFRPTLLCLNSVFASLGVVVTNILGISMHWRSVAFLSGSISLITLIGIWFYCPESPLWILNFHPDKHEVAKKNFRRLYTNEQIFLQEWDSLITSYQARQHVVKLAGDEISCWDKFHSSQNLVPLLIVSAIFLFQQLSGSYTIFFYAVNLFQSIGGNLGAMDEYFALILLGVIRFVISSFTTVASMKVGRRPLLIASGLGMSVTSLITAILFHKKPYEGLFQNKMNQNVTESMSRDGINTISCLGPISILLYIGMCSFGFMIIPWTLIAELLPLSIRGLGSGIVICVTHIVMFGAVKSFPFILTAIRISGVFYFFCFISIIATIFVYYFLPETLGKSLEEIRKYFTPVTNNSKKTLQ